jgi:hypothetical protein
MKDLYGITSERRLVEELRTAVVLPHHDQQASDDQNQTEHGRMLSSNMLPLNLILLIDVTFSTPTPDFVNRGTVNGTSVRPQDRKES